MNKEYKYFKFSDIFAFKRGKRYVKEQHLPGDIAYISSTAFNNGIDDFVSPPIKMTIYKNKLTFSNSGSRGILFYHDYEFVASDHVTVVWIKNKELNKYIALFLKPIFEHLKYKYNFAREISDKRIINEIVYLPVNKEQNPDWEYMEYHIKSLETKITFNPVYTKNIFSNKTLDIANWKIFKIKDLFDVVGSKTTPKYDLEMVYGIGEYPYITTRSTNNGVAGFYNHFTEKGNVITIDSATDGFVSYQAMDFSASDHVELLIPKFEFNKYIAMFIRTIIMKHLYKYAYGRKFNQGRIKSTELLLPITSEGQPDWQFMENYIKSLPYADNI